MNTNNSNTDYTLSSIRLQPQNSSDKELDPNDFTDRSDFIFFKKVYNLHVQLSFLNESHFNSPVYTKGIHRHIAIALFDIKENKVLISIATLLRIRADQATCDMVCTLPLEAVTVNPANTHKVIVRDIKSGDVLGEKMINWYCLNTIRVLPTKWYRPVCGFVCPKGDLYSTPHLCLAAEDDEPVCIKFKLEPHYRLGKDNMPEVEIRLYEPDGHGYSSALCRPYWSRFDNYKTYTVDMQFTTGMRNRGVHYAEMRVAGYKVCGFLFTTTGPSIEGSWSDKYLSTIEDHSSAYIGMIYDERISEKLREEPENDSEPATEVARDTLESMIEEFTTLQQEEDHTTFYIAEEECEKTGDNTIPSLRDITARLDDMVGLRAVKDKVKSYANIVMFNRMRVSSGFPTLPLPLHAMFLGSPGTGKTTVAKLMGSMLAQAGILSSGHVVVRERATLIGQYYSSEGENTRAAIEEARGGILFIDEAYQLFQPDDPKDPGRFVIETMLTALADEASRDWMLILAGYPEPMKRLFEFNPGFKSRIPESNIYMFDDFSHEELMQIADNYLKKNDFTLSAAARDKLKYVVANALTAKDDKFGNARFIETLIQTEILPSMASRVADIGMCTTDVLSVIEASDIPTPIVVEAPRRLGFIA